MDFTFTHSDKRNYRRSTKGEVVIATKPTHSEKVSLTISNDNSRLLILALTKAEASAIANGLNAACSDGVCDIKIKPC